MNHLDEITLNEYLDDALDQSRINEINVHLQSCATCREKLDQLQSVFAVLQALPEASLKHDLTPSILARLSQKAPLRVWTRSIAAQVGVAIGLMFWLAIQAIPFIKFPIFKVPQIPALDMQALLTRLLAFQIPIPHLQFPTFSYRFPTFDFRMPTLALAVSNTQLILLSISALLLWLVGNAVLLRNRQGVGE